MPLTLPSQPRERIEEKKKSRKRRKRESTYLYGVHALYPLECTEEEILVLAERQGLINQWPRKMKDNPKRQKSDKYCRFHRDRGHTTEECHHLKNEIEKLIQRGYLRQYVNQGQSSQPQAPMPDQQPNGDNLPTAGVIAVISGGQQEETPLTRGKP
ncbi:UNVERIFIED_CONTAM: hypothetical protein Sradi_3050400 [Sesamum radiatum]|uniref:Uncharacterized protein n=1 Tax=Sesamum radiatum TaxID=300843 RepID=A0AAW2RBR7_SESRA